MSTALTPIRVTPSNRSLQRRIFPIGAEVMPQGVHFRVWAPDRRRVDVLIHRHTMQHKPPCVELEAEGNGYFSGLVQGIGAGSLYSFRLDDSGAFPDPASRFQPEGPHGPSQVIDPSAYVWTDSGWLGKNLRG